MGWFDDIGEFNEIRKCILRSKIKDVSVDSHTNCTFRSTFSETNLLYNNNDTCDIRYVVWVTAQQRIPQYNERYTHTDAKLDCYFNFATFRMQSSSLSEMDPSFSLNIEN